MSDPKLTPAEAGLEACDAYQQLADQLDDLDPDTARVIRRVTEDIASVIKPRLPEWMRLDEVKRHTGWSLRTLRDRARELEADGLARKSPHWEIHRKAIGRELEVREDHDTDLIDMSDIRGTAERLANLGGPAA